MFHLKIPVATYRLQFNKQFRFEDAHDLVPYLHQLGISDLYASPIFKARKGSPHGYDVTDPTCLNPELGTETDFDALVRELRSHKMGLLLDIVPNHMAASPENTWWQDLLDKGQESPYASFFDTDWLAFERVKSKITDHRRFFDIGDLVGIRVEESQVFEAVHSLVLRLIAEGKITGLRIDHIDGLYDPLEYLLRLQHYIAHQTSEARKKASFYVVVEKILSDNETLPEEWAVFGTTGYDFANIVNALFVDGNGAQALDEIYSRFTGIEATFDTIVYEKKKQVMCKLFHEEIKALGRYLAYLAQKAGYTPPPSQVTAKEVLTEVIASMPIYRTYTRTLEISPRDKVYLENALQEATQRSSTPNTVMLDFLQQVLLLDFPNTLSQEQKDQWQNFVLRWQQLTGAIMAKGVEDTALYTYNRLISLNEVGGNPSKQGLSINEFHKHNIRKSKHCPHTLNATSTHDTKRSEDVRARINVLSEIPEEWEKMLTRWSERNQLKKRRVNGLPVPEPNTETLLYQTLIGAWPLYQKEARRFKKRLKEYIIKATREAKTYTNWIRPDQQYEDSLIQFIESILQASKANRFLDDFLQFQSQVAYYGAFNSLAQVLLKITSPGVPDFYQGTELWDFSLVDPDNRRPVNFEERKSLLDNLIQQEARGQQLLVQRILESWQDGRVKLYVAYKALNVRRASRDLFEYGDYIPLQVHGEKQEHICAFARIRRENWTLTVVPRLLTKLIGVGDLPCGQRVWKDNKLLLPNDAPECWLNVFTEENVRVLDEKKQLALADIFTMFPVALLKSI